MLNYHTGRDIIAQVERSAVLIHRSIEMSRHVWRMAGDGVVRNTLLGYYLLQSIGLPCNRRMVFVVFCWSRLLLVIYLVLLFVNLWEIYGDHLQVSSYDDQYLLSFAKKSTRNIPLLFFCKFYCLFFAQDLQISSYKGHAQPSPCINYKVYP